MSETKDLLRYILVYSGPKDDKKLRFLATDAGDGMQIAKHVVVKVADGWAEKVVEALKDSVDPETLDMLNRWHDAVLGLLNEGRGSVWISPHIFRVLSPSGLKSID